MTDKTTPAFPRAGHEWSAMEWVPAPAEQGMTLRDYFAAKAMVVYWSDPDAPDSRKTAAEWAYMMADAMLEARES